MISYIRGELAAQYEDKVIVDVGGVGYGIYMSAQSMSKLPPVGSEVKIHTYLNVKEDSMQLFGFLTVDDLNVFKLLIGVSGIGPKGGQAILSVLSPDDLRFAVMADDVKAISIRTWDREKKQRRKLIVELKDKLSIEDALEHTITEEGALKAQMSTGGEIQSEAVQALVALGYGNTEALKAVKQVEITPDMQVEELLKRALKFMFFVSLRSLSKIPGGFT